MKITIDGLSEKSLLDAAQQVERYRKRMLAKNREFIKALTQAGIKVIYQNLVGEGDSEPPTLATDNPYVMVGSADGKMRATLKLRGKDVAFVEFGAGIFYNQVPAGSSPNPLGVQLGFTIGSYGQGNGAYDYWFYEKDGQTFMSQGTQATMPLYKADMEIRQRYIDIAKSVFGG